MFLKDSWDTSSFVTNYLPFMLFPIMYVGARIWRRRGPIKPEDMDFVSGIAEIEAATYEEPPPRNAAEKFWQWLVRTFQPWGMGYVADAVFLYTDVKVMGVIPLYLGPISCRDILFRSYHYSVNKCCLIV